MKNRNLILLTLIATVLMGSALTSFAAADPNVSNATSPPYDPKATPQVPPPNDDVNTNMPTIPLDNETFHILANQTSINDIPESGAAGDPSNLIASAPNSNPDNTLAIVAIVVALVAIVGGAIGIINYRKHAKKTEN